MARPYFIHGDYVLMDRGDKLLIYKHKPTSYYYYGERAECTAVHDNTCYKETVISDIRGRICRTFAYVKTEESLSVYRRW
jgi:hypothetical protein